MTVFVDISFQKSERSKRVILEENDELVIGRSNDDSLMTADPRLSRKHFIIRHVNGCVEVEHLSRTNPTLVAEGESRDFQEVNSVLSLQQGCRIIAGFHRFVVSFECNETVQQSSPPEFDAASSWGDVQDEEDYNPPSRAIPNRSTQQGKAPYSFEDSVDDSPRQNPERSSRPNPSPGRPRKVISFESEYAPDESKQQSEADALRATAPIKAVRVNAEKPDDDDSAITPPPANDDARKPKFDLDDSTSASPVVDHSVDAKSDQSSADDSPKQDAVKERKTGFPKKLNFPVADSFFDD